MRPMLSAVLGLAAALVLPAVASAACPTGEAYLIGPGTVSIDAAQFQSSDVEPGTSFVNATVACDLVAGTLSAYSGGLHPQHTWIVVRDAFDVTGVPAGTPVSLVVQFVAEGTSTSPGCGGSGCAAGAAATVTSDAQTAYDDDGGVQFGPSSRALHVDVELPLVIVAGTPRTIEFELEAGRAAGGDHSVTIAGTYRITAPAGVGVVSCHGFAQSTTPAQAASWGTVKAAYR